LNQAQSSALCLALAYVATMVFSRQWIMFWGENTT
jgi:hypothetical protein